MKPVALIPTMAAVMTLAAGMAVAQNKPSEPPTQRPLTSQTSKASPPAGAQPAQGWSTPANPWATESTAYTEWMKSTVDFEFRGGTLQEYVDVIRAAAAGKPVNVMFRDGAERMQVAPTSMKDVSIYGALQAPTDFQNVASFRGMSLILQQVGGQQSGPPPTTVPAFVYVGTSGGGPRGEVYVLSLNEVCTPPWQKKGDDAALPTDAVLKAVETAVTAASSDPKPADIAFHRESGLLVIKGNERQIAAAKNVIDRLGGDVRRIRQERDLHEDKAKNDVGEVEVQRVRAQQLEKTLDELRRETARLTTMRDQMRVELDDAMRKARDLQAKLDAANSSKK